MKTNELTGVALDWAVAMCEGLEFDESNQPIWFDADGLGVPCVPYTPSTDWAQGGPIIEREKISVNPSSLPCNDWIADTKKINEKTHQYGLTPLIAAMRCYVASKLGAEVDVPKELTP